MDVDDCKAVVDDLVARGTIDGGRVAVVGGSHGGFLTGHLLGQHPEAFTCGVMRNPVLDVRLMVHVRVTPAPVRVTAALSLTLA
jgi:acylaminoacyl-peptidase